MCFGDWSRADFITNDELVDFLGDTSPSLFPNDNDMPDFVDDDVL